MKIAVMQPYVFPNLGYFQLINAIDTFVFYDDVNFRKQGFINRNKILANSKPFQFTIPCKAISSNKLIKDTLLDFKTVNRDKFLRTLNQSYTKSPQFEIVYPKIEAVIKSNSIGSVANLAIESIKMVTNYLEIDKIWKKSSVDYSDSKGLEKTQRLIAISKKEFATEYINLIGGQDLYRSNDFEIEGLNLSFLKSNAVAYKQFNNEFIPGLSIIDCLMFNSSDKIKTLLNAYEILRGPNS